MKYFFLFFFLSFAVYGCVKKTLLDHDFEANLLLTEARIDASTGVEIYLTKTFSPQETVNLDTLVIADASITLFENNDSIGELLYDEDSFKYYYTNLNNIVPGNTYAIEIVVAGYPVVYSEPIVLIDSPALDFVSIVRTNDTTEFYSQTEVTFNLSDNLEEDNMYLIDWFVGSNEYYEELQIHVKDGSILDCATPIKPYLLDNCFNGLNDIPITIYASYGNSIFSFIDDFEGFNSVATDTTIFNFRSVDEFGQKYLRSQSYSIFEEEQTSVPPITFSNMSNGIGVFYSVGNKSYTLTSP